MWFNKNTYRLFFSIDFFVTYDHFILLYNGEEKSIFVSTDPKYNEPSALFAFDFLIFPHFIAEAQDLFVGDTDNVE